VAVYVFDSAPLSCFARARQLPMLDRLTAGNDRVTTRAVIHEIRNGVGAFPELQDVLDLEWLLGLIRFRGQFGYAACLSVNALSNSPESRGRTRWG
jgi:hypothetical protein